MLCYVSETRVLMWPMCGVRSRVVRILGSRNSGTSFCLGEIHTSNMRIGFGRAPEIPDSDFMNWA